MARVKYDTTGRYADHPQEIHDLLSKLHFDTAHGQIWFDEYRMLLLHTSIMGYLRKDLAHMIGLERTKHFFIRLGYQAGLKDAEVTTKMRPDLNEHDAFMAGPQMHAIRGMVQVQANQLNLSHDKKQFYADLNWLNSFEADVHLEHFGLSDEPSCWMLLGYACGYSSFATGMTIIYQEIECKACGHEHCRIIGKPLEEWENADELIQFMSPEPMEKELIALQAELFELKRSIYSDSEADYQLFSSVGKSASYKQVCALLTKAAGSKVSILLQGETGVGKEAFARGVHENSQRKDQPFIAVNCAAIPLELIESELFGVEKGAYTGAHQSRLGKFERANGGTIFLDEVIELSPRAQATLLRILQEGEFERVGDSQTRILDVRVITATNEDLEQAVKTGRFRADLYYRLNIFPVQIPPLRERREDIPLLVEHFLRRFEKMYGKTIQGVSEKTKVFMQQYEWPGNIRELENLLERAVLLTDDQQLIKLNAIFPQIKHDPEQAITIETDFGQLLQPEFNLEEHERQLILTALKKANHNVSEAARLLGITRAALDYRIKKFQI
ncbi:phenol degradation transcriptional regulator MobR [Acinetobacter baumannii]|uniref:phenol degradation transcriptional regulator MobR n=1 Tax=Acinetobacter baumannii TaxID=470 RepID=UPI0038B47BC9